MTEAARQHYEDSVVIHGPFGAMPAPGGPLQPPGGGGTYDDMEARVAKLEADVANIKTGVAEIKSDLKDAAKSLSGAVVDIAVLKERMAQLPSKGYIVTALILLLAAIAALVGFQHDIQQFIAPK